MERNITVIGYSGYRADERPRWIIIKGRRLAVTSVIEQGLLEHAADRRRIRRFSVECSDGRTYKLEYDESADAWSAI